MVLSHTKPLKLGFSRATSLKLLIRFFGVISSYQIHPARVAQLVEHQLPKLRVASSNLVSRSVSHPVEIQGVFFLICTPCQLTNVVSRQLCGKCLVVRLPVMRSFIEVPLPIR